MNKSNYSTVGKPVRKVDGIELVTGAARFTGDMRFPGMLHGAAARAGVPAGHLREVKTGAASRAEGVVEIITAKDLLGPNLIGILPPFDQPILAEGEIRYAGESVALVVADSRRGAREAAELIESVIEPYEPILTVDEALAEDARKIHENGNVTFSRRLTKGDAEKGLGEADFVVEGEYETSFQEHAYMEPEAVCAVPESDGRITVYASCQSPFHIRGHVAANIGYPASRVKVVQAFTGGSFGGKDDVATEIGSLAATAAVITGRPVMIEHTREESVIGSNFRHASRIRIATGVKKDGTVTARKIYVLLDGGAYASESPFVTMKGLIHAAGPYTIDNVFVEATTVYTNKTYCGAFRGFGVPQVTFASESQMDEAAEKIGMDKLKFRRKNGLKPGDATATSQVFDESVGLIQTIDRIAEIKLPPINEETETAGSGGRYLRGTGYSCLLQGISNGAEGVDVVGASVQMSQDGSVLVGVGLTELGQGAKTVYAQVAAEILGVTVDRVTVKLVDTDGVHDSGPTVASRSTTVGGKAVEKAARAVRESLEKMVSLMTGADQESIRIGENTVRIEGDKNTVIPLSEAATAAYWTGFPLMHLEFSQAPAADYDHETHQGNIYIAYNFGTHRMDVRIDRYTGKVEVLRHAACHDVGKVINPLGFEGQVQGASLIGFGLAHMEKIEYSAGTVLNSNFADYAVPTMLDRIDTEPIAVEEANPSGPFGAKGIGEPPVAGTVAAFANAVAAATGIRFTKLPITRQDILRALEEKDRQGGTDG